jgi:hypothetical protein
VAAGEELSVSATSYVTYLRCPDQALARYQGHFPADTKASFRGQLAHRVISRHLNHGPIDAAGFANACREEIGAAMNPKVAAVGLKPSTLAAVIQEVGDLYTRFKQLAHDGVRATEVLLEDEPAPGVTLRGSIDAVFDAPGGRGAVLVDWKTGHLGDAADQLAFYAMLWSLVHRRLPGRVEAVSVSTGERYADSPSWTDVEGTAHRVAELVSALRRASDTGRRLDRIGGSWCSYCPMLGQCPEGGAAVAVLAPSATRRDRAILTGHGDDPGLARPS